MPSDTTPTWHRRRNAPHMPHACRVLLRAVSTAAPPSPDKAAEASTPLGRLRLLHALCTCAPMRPGCMDDVLLGSCAALLHACAPAAARGEPELDGGW